MNLNEPTKNSNTIFSGRIINLRIDDVVLPNGKVAKREIVEHGGGVSILAINKDGKIIMVKQYRKPAEKVLLEIPAGKLNIGEKPDECAKRELMEETGYIAKELKHLFSFYPSPGFSTEVLHLYLANDLEKGTPHTDPDEFLNVYEYSVDEIKEMIENGLIEDAKTLIALLYYIK
ncbi:NUDIX hydrolase [Thermoanaerobacterium thermosaccharolyticum]|jgi:ADP-ribose pyrophosphatase|uniref:NTP pyrophosphohydrolase n=1 Tax=Thermoanaerobacterium thermosaccharolyticum M0795 TaxID=698948 RepID=L0IHE4_THETR|nr:NUDIX hydrolase [Thermoanaerobacterium thermosaccharolyticum]AGB18935.1 NTP pyrophosphohydrolase [Thermoanaerobacterium thermosaccharolyticum M0795]